jgi:uracil-DNA glycosylase
MKSSVGSADSDAVRRRRFAEKSEQLIAFWRRCIEPKESEVFDLKERWWTFPPQAPVMGFFGVRPLIVIGDQPSTSPWPKGHRSRTLLYETLIKLGVPDAHLTDVIKKRGPGGESRKKLPSDFSVHLDLLRREIAIIQPSRIVALGECAEQLLRDYLPDLQDKVRGAKHFAWGARPGTGNDVVFETEFRAAIYDETIDCSAAAVKGGVDNTSREQPVDHRGFSLVNPKSGNRQHGYQDIALPSDGTITLLREPAATKQNRGGEYYAKLHDGMLVRDRPRGVGGVTLDYLRFFVYHGVVAVAGATRISDGAVL